MKFSAIVPLFATIAAADWTSSCSSWSSTDTRRSITAKCTSDAGSSVCSTLDLNDCLAFDGTNLLWQIDGNFSPAGATFNDGISQCVDTEELCTYLSNVRGSTELKCDCFNAATSALVDTSIELAEQITVNSGGYLTCLGQVAASC